MFAVSKLVYNRLYEILEDATETDLSYLELLQRGFHPTSENLLAPTMYPWVFIEYVSQSNISIHRAPTVWKYELTLGIVALTLADRSDFDSIVYREDDSKNTNPGIGDMIEDIQSVLWAHHNDFGIPGGVVNNWTIARIGAPSVLQVQALMMSDLVRGLQIDVTFNIVERES